MALKDEDEELAAPTREELFKAGKGKKERLIRKKQERGKKLEAEKAKLKTNVELGELAKEGQKDEEKKRKEKADEETEQKEPIGTKTLKEEEEAKIVTAGMDIGPEELIEQEQRDKEAQAEAEEEYQKEGG